MTIKASASVTLTSYRDIESVTRYYKLQSSTASAPSVPTTNPPSGWTTTEPSYTSASTNSLYFCDLTVYSDGTFSYTPVSKSSSYEAAKEAWNKAQNAQDSVDDANNKIDLIEQTGTGGNLIKNGYGELLDNTNFSNGTFTRGDSVEGSYGYFTNGITEKISFNPNVIYEYEYYVRLHEGESGTNYFSIVPYDVDSKIISEHNILFYNKNLFYLSEDLKNGDTVVHFTDLTNWRTDTTQTYQRSFIVFGYSDSTGYTYPDGTYSQKYYNYIYDSNDSVDKTNNTITLKSAWTKGTIAAGTCIGQTSYGSTYCYYGQTGTISNTEWVKHSGLIDVGELNEDSAANTIRLHYAKNIAINLYNGKADYCRIYLGEKVIDKEASKVATNYMNFDETNGLVVGNMTAETLGNNVRIDNDSVDIRSGSNVLATFASNLISLGKAAANAVIELCDGVGSMYAEANPKEDSLFNRFFIRAKYLFLKGRDITIDTSTQYENTSQSFSESGHASIGVYSYDREDIPSYGGFSLTAVSEKNGYRAQIAGGTSSYWGETGGSVSINVANSSEYNSFIFDTNQFRCPTNFICQGSRADIAGDLYFNVNNTSIYGTNADDVEVKSEVFIPLNANNNTVLGWGNYDKKSGNTHIYGHDVNIGVSNCNSPGLYRPYFRPGDTITFTLRTAGYVTNSGTQVYFCVPLAKPILGGTTVTASSVNGFVFRQGNKYTHGSTSSTYVTGTYTTSYIGGGFVSVAVTLTDTTNVTNNDAIGIQWSGKLTFS